MCLNTSEEYGATYRLITLGVADLERATRFYEQCLGLPRLKTPPSIYIL